MKPIEAYWKLDHTICMNSNEGNIKWNIDNKDDKTLYGENQEGYDPIDTDCKSIDEAIDCLETIEKAVKALDIIKKYNSKCSDNKIRLSCYDRPEWLDKEPLHMDYLIIGNACFEITKEECEILREVLKDAD